MDLTGKWKGDGKEGQGKEGKEKVRKLLKSNSYVSGDSF